MSAELILLFLFLLGYGLRQKANNWIKYHSLIFLFSCMYYFGALCPHASWCFASWLVFLLETFLFDSPQEMNFHFITRQQAMTCYFFKGALFRVFFSPISNEFEAKHVWNELAHFWSEAILQLHRWMMLWLSNDFSKPQTVFNGQLWFQTFNLLHGGMNEDKSLSDDNILSPARVENFQV